MQTERATSPALAGLVSLIVAIDSPKMLEKKSRKSKQQTLLYHAAGKSQKQAAELAGIAERTLRRAKARQHWFGDIQAGYEKRGRKSLFTPLFKDVLILV